LFFLSNNLNSKHFPYKEGAATLTVQFYSPGGVGVGAVAVGVVVAGVVS